MMFGEWLPQLCYCLTDIGVSLNAMWKYFQFMLSYQQKKDEIFTWSTQTEVNPELSTISYINFDRMPTLNAFIGASPTIGFC